MEIVQEFITVSTILRAIQVVIIFSIAWIVQRLSWRIAGLILALHNLTLSPAFPIKKSQRPRRSFFSGLDRVVSTETMSKTWSDLNKWLPHEFKAVHRLRQERQQTLQQLLANAIGLLAFLIAIVVSLGLYVDQNTVVWVTGLFGTALAFAGRTFIGDLLAGINIIFQDKFDVGEKILVKSQMETIEGVVEHVSLNATWLRARTGELFIIANGEMRFICNFSRGLHSSANITIRIAATDLDRALSLLKNLGEEAVQILPDLREPWQVISETGTIGQNIELTLAVKTHFGQAADLRPQLLALVQKRLTMADISLVG
jgi:small-conductance mechanosensitive channel